MSFVGPLKDRLDEVGWSNKDDWRGFTFLMFLWMQEATAEIHRLTTEVERLKSDA